MKRFFEKIDKTSYCWNWTASSRGNGYGAFKFKGKVIDAHRVSWMIHNGEIPKGLFVCHKCDNRKCVNPDHLFLGTQKDNMQDCKNKGRLVTPKKECFKKGHVAYNAKLQDSIVLLILKKIKEGIKLIDISKELCVSYQTIRDINIGRSYINIRLNV